MCVSVCVAVGCTVLELAVGDCFLLVQLINRLLYLKTNFKSQRSVRAKIFVVITEKLKLTSGNCIQLTLLQEGIRDK